MLSERVEETARFLRHDWNGARIGLVLGSGLSGLTEETKKEAVFPYGRIPHFPESTVKGHRGELILTELERIPVAVLSGRFHYYEGYSLQEVTFPIRVLARLGIKTLILTNAAGGIDVAFQAGDIMVISDHLNFFPENPLRGVRDGEFGERFVSLSDAYDPALRKIAFECAANLKLRIHEGVYLALPGPTYETPAEIRMYRSFGASAVGMSTVPEVIVARQERVSILALSLITNVHTNGGSLTHQEVLTSARISEARFKSLIKCVIKKI